MELLMPKPWKHKHRANTSINGYRRPECNFWQCEHFDRARGCLLNRNFRNCPIWTKQKISGEKNEYIR